MRKYLLVSQKSHTFASLMKRKPPTTGVWRDGRVVDYSSLENCRPERCRGFASLSLRKGLISKSLMRPFYLHTNPGSADISGW